MKRLFLVAETLFVITFWWQTRIDLSQWWPGGKITPVISDYLIPFIYLSDILLLMTLVLWSLLEAGGWWRQLASWRPSRLMWQRWWLWWLGLLLVVAVGLWLKDVGWWGWYGWLKLVEGGLMIILVSSRWRQPGVAARYGFVLLLDLVVTALLLIGEWVIQRSLGLQWLGEWQFSVATPGIAKMSVAGAEYLRPYATFSHPNVAAAILALGLPWIILAPWPSWLKRWPERWRWLGVGLVGVGLVLTFSRSAWLVSLICLVWALWPMVYVRVSNRAWLSWRPQTSVLMLAGGAILLLTLMGPLVVERFVSLSTTDASSLDRRIQLNQVAVELIQESPIWGAGLRQFVPEVSQYGPLYGVGVWRQPAHNFGLLVAAEVGLLGLAAFLAVVVAMVAPTARQWWYRRDDWIGRLILGTWLGWWLLGLIDHYWWTNQQGWLAWCILAGMTVGYVHQSRRSLADGN